MANIKPENLHAENTNRFGDQGSRTKPQAPRPKQQASSSKPQAPSLHELAKKFPDKTYRELESIKHQATSSKVF